MDFQSLCPLLSEEKRRSKDIAIHVQLASSLGTVRMSQPNHLTYHKVPAIPTAMALTGVCLLSATEISFLQRVLWLIYSAWQLQASLHLENT